MKTNSLICLFATFALLGLTLTQAIQAPKLSCDNGFTKRFKTKDDSKSMILSEPLKEGFDICVNEWSVYGTCCDVTKLKTLINARISKYSNRITNFMKKLNRVDKVYKRVGKIKVKMTKIRTWMKKDKNEITSKDLMRKAETYLESIDDKLQFFDNYEEKKKMYVGSVKTCYEEIKKFRAGVFCAMCSGRADQFLSEGKLKITKNTCTSLVQVCGKTWDFTYKLMQVFKTIRASYRIWRPKQMKEMLKPRKEVGPDTTGQFKTIAPKLKSAVNLGASVEYNKDIGELCEKLFVAVGENDDLAGDAEIIEEGVKEQEVKDKEDEKLSPDQKKKFEQEVQAARTALKNEKEKKCAVMKEKIASIKKALAEVETIMKEKFESAKKNIEEMKKKREAMEKETEANKIGQLKTEFAREMGLAATASSAINMKYAYLTAQLRAAYQICPESISQEDQKHFKEKIGEFRKKMDELKKKDSEKNKFDEDKSKDIKKTIEHKGKAIDHAFKTYRDSVRKIEEYKKKHPTKRRILQAVKPPTPAPHHKKDEKKDDNKGEDLQKLIANRDAAYKTLTSTWVELQTAIKTFFSSQTRGLCPRVRAEIMKWYSKYQYIIQHANKINYAMSNHGKMRVLEEATGTSASGQVVIANDDTTAAEIPKPEDKAPTGSATINPEDANTKATNNFSLKLNITGLVLFVLVSLSLNF